MDLVATPAARVELDRLREGKSVVITAVLQGHRLSFRMALAEPGEAPGKDPVHFEASGIPWVTLADSLEYLEGLTIDYVEDGPSGSGFLVSSSYGGCGCGGGDCGCGGHGAHEHEQESAGCG